MRGRRLRLIGVLGLVLVLVAAGGALLWLRTGPSGDMRASSQQWGHGAALAAPGVKGDWRPDDEPVGAWLERSWGSPVDVRRVEVRASRTEDASAITSGYLHFSDGSQVNVRLSGEDTVVALTPRQVTSMRFTVTDVDGDGAVGVAELVADAGRGPDGAVATDAPSDGDVAATSSLSTSAGDAAKLVDADPDTSAVVGGGVGLTWERPRELTRVSVAGRGGGATIRRAHLAFSDGSTLPFGGVTADPTRPTTVAFMPRVTTSLRLVVDEVEGVGDLGLSAVAAFQRGAAPTGPTGPTGGEPEVTGVADLTGVADADGDDDADGADGVCSSSEDRPSDDAGVVVLCPTNGSVVDDTVRLTIAAGPAYSLAMARAWPAEPKVRATRVVRAELGSDGTADLDLDVSTFPPGPFIVAVGASGAGAEVSKVYLQLVRPGELGGEVAQAPGGRSLVYHDEFDAPLSANRSGEGADYVSGKPESGGVTDFGEAIFADPTLGLGNVTQVGEDYLKLGVTPRPDDFADPQGWGREHLGGMVASARPGGSGVSAQYGYFEARMLAPAAPGTWPAFWLLTTPNLVDQQPTVAEIDAVELYGHDPVSACQTSHQYPDPDEVGEALCGQRWTSERQATQWHTYGVDVRPDRIVYYLDGKQVGDAPQVGAGDEPMFFMLDLALGGGWPVDLSAVGDRADLYVDWVRVYV